MIVCPGMTRQGWMKHCTETTLCGMTNHIKYLLSEIPHFFSRTKWLSPDTFLLLTYATQYDEILIKHSNTVA